MRRSFRELEAFCLQFSGAYADYPWGPDTIVFKVEGHIFAMPSSAGAAALSVACKVSPTFREAYRAHPATYTPPYVGRFGWLGIEVTDDETWDMATAAIEESYALVRFRGRRRPGSKTPPISGPPDRVS